LNRGGRKKIVGENAGGGKEKRKGKSGENESREQPSQGNTKEKYENMPGKIGGAPNWPMFVRERGKRIIEEVENGRF